MKNILSSLNESEKKRIIEMHTNKKSYLFEAVENKTVQLDCVAKTVNGIVVTQANLLANLCPSAKGTTTQETLAQQYKMTNKNQVILTSAELASIGATSASVILDTNNRVQGITFKMKNVKNNPASQGGGEASPTYSTVTDGSGRVAGQVSQADAYEKEQPGVKKLMQTLGKKQADASNSFK